MLSLKQCSNNETDLLETDEVRAFQGTGVLLHQLQTPNFPGSVLTIPGLSSLQKVEWSRGAENRVLGLHLPESL